MPRFGGIATFMRLPGTTPPEQLDVAVVGVPFDIGTSNRPGARFGPRGIRSESVLLRPYNMATRAAPFDSLRIDDIGDVATNPYNLADSVQRIESHYDGLLGSGVVTASMGGDHTIVLPILRAIAKKPRAGRPWFTSMRTPTSTIRCSVSGSPTAPLPTCRRGRSARLRTRCPDRGPRHRVRRRRLRLVASTGVPSRAGRGVLAPQPGAVDGRDPRSDRRHARLSQPRHRRPRSVVRPRDRDPGGRRAHRSGKVSRSSAAAAVSTSSVATSWRSPRSTTRPARRRWSPPTCSTRCSASARRRVPLKPGPRGRGTLPEPRPQGWG